MANGPNIRSSGPVNPLREIIAKRDEWGAFDYALAQKILRDRGQEVAPEELEKL